MAASRGIVSFALVLVFSALLAHVADTRIETAKESHFAKQAVFSLEKRYYADLEVKNAFRQALANAQGAGGEEKTVDAARKLALLEQFAEAEFAERGIQVDLWLGDAGAADFAELRKRMLAERRTLKPGGALDLSVHVLDWRGRPVPLAAALLAHDPASGKVLVARNTALVPEQPFLMPVFGASIYFDDVAAVAVIGEGFHG